MDEIDFEGTLGLEKRAEIGKIDAFYEAIDSDDLALAERLMWQANIDAEAILRVELKCPLI